MDYTFQNGDSRTDRYRESFIFHLPIIVALPFAVESVNNAQTQSGYFSVATNSLSCDRHLSPQWCKVIVKFRSTTGRRQRTVFPFFIVAHLERNRYAVSP